ncbi:Cytochrome P450 9e2 [Eumeta japonica]|uniref:unspecific monooxygenase n=1 Tax=Eumeta variegata TaxID=151549 RepID=A0A4C1WJT2_EUMVA|nr:Cytochrome P450 9e2 [Eumeta japonica]
MIIEIVVLVLTAVVVYAIYKHRKNVNEFRRNGLNVLPGVPLLGNTYKSVFKRRHIFHDFDEVYRAFPDDKYVGYVDGMNGALFIRDPDIIKQITIKDFDHFVNRGWILNDKDNPLLSNSLLFMKDERWHEMRTTLSPAFTGSKMKKMVPFMITAAGNIVEHLNKQISGDVSEGVHLDDVMRRYTNDVIASSAFGLEVNSVADRDNEFYATGQRMSNPNIWQKFNFLLVTIFPFLAKKFNLKLCPDEITDFFRNIVKNTMEYRKINNVERPDMIQLLMEAAKGTLASSKENDESEFDTARELNSKTEIPIKKWTADELTAQAFLFFSAGFESSASTLTLAVHELAINPDVQRKLYEEIQNLGGHKTALSYEMIQTMKYLDMVVNETLRKWAPAIILNRVCTKPYLLPPARPGAATYRVEKGKMIYCFVSSIHMDEKYYPDPDRFNPDRFSEDNKRSREPFTFIPFGTGPRNCIGSRFALLELKVFLYYLILNFEILKFEETTDPLRLSASDFNIKAQGGSWVKLRKRVLD